MGSVYLFITHDAYVCGAMGKLNHHDFTGNRYALRKNRRASRRTIAATKQTSDSVRFASRKRRKYIFLRNLIGAAAILFGITLLILDQNTGLHRAKTAPSLVPEWVKHGTIFPEDVAVQPTENATEVNLNRVTAGTSAKFDLCHSGGGRNCIVDGDTFWFQGQKIRIADIDTPETHPPRCTEEERLGKAATLRLHQLLNSGAFRMATPNDGRDRDKYGRLLRIITRDGQSIGSILVAEGLAKPYIGGPRDPWCA